MEVFTAHHQPGARRPGIQVDQPGDLDHLCPVADLAAGFAGGFPVLFLHEQEGAWEAPAESVRTSSLWTARAGSSPARWPACHSSGELVDGGGQGDDVVSSAVGPGVARPEHPGQHLAGLGQLRRERMVS